MLHSCMHTGPDLSCQLGFQQLEQVEMAKMVGPNLAFKALHGVAQGACHDTRIADEGVYSGLLIQHFCKLCDAAEVCKV